MFSIRWATLSWMALLLGLGLVFSPAMAQTASAGSNFGRVVNNYGSPVRIDCNYGQGPYHTLYELPNSRTSYSWKYCSDTDRFRSLGDRRCIYYGGPGYKDGWYILAANVWRKVAGLAKVDIYPYNSKCNHSPYFNYV